jgi:hypothetical protein
MDTSAVFRFDDIRAFVHEAVRQRPIATHSHPSNDDVYRELERCIRYGKDDPATMNAQIQRYRAEGFPEGTGMVTSSILVRDSAHPRLREFEDGWWREIEQGSFRDQLSFNFVSWKLKIPYAIFAPLDWGPLFRNQYFEFGKHEDPPSPADGPAKARNTPGFVHS